MAVLTVAPIRRKAISPKVAITIDAINANPRLRELYDLCATLNDDQLKKLVKVLRGYKPAKGLRNG